METPAHTDSVKTPFYAWLAALVPLAIGIAFATTLPDIAAGNTLRWSAPWIPQLNIEASFFLDSLSLLFALLITGVGTLVLLYSAGYMRGTPYFGRFTLYLLVFMLSMLGLVLSDNLILLFVFWELTTITSYLLIGYDHENATARRSARQGLLVTGAGGLAMLAGFVVLGEIVDSYELSELRIFADAIRGHELYPVVLTLILCGAFTKSAQFPFHFWLPNAMAAPTPVSAFLHSATMVKAGVYLLARLHPTLGDTRTWMIVLTLFGGFTAIYASVLAIRQHDLKQMLAYTTVMALGTSIMFLGATAGIGIIAAVTFIFVHALYKAGLFLVVGILEHETGTRDVRRLGGLARAMPLTAAAATLSALSMAGLPPFIGFVGKELLYKGALAWSLEPAVAIAAIFLAKILMVTVALVFIVDAFLGPQVATPKRPHEAPFSMWFGPLFLGLVALLGGLVPDLFGRTLLVPAAGAIMGFVPEYQLALWHGINIPLAMSLLTFLLGYTVYALRTPVYAFLDRMSQRWRLSGDIAYDHMMGWLASVAVRQTAILQHGVHRGYLLVTFATLALALVGTLSIKSGVSWPSGWPVLSYTEWVLAGLIVAAAVGILVAESRLLAICALGVIGTAVALIFLIYGAPDTALTQLIVEALTVVIIALVLLRLPGFQQTRAVRRDTRLRDGVVALAVGGSVGMTVLTIATVPTDLSITHYFERMAVPEAFGRNIVNVILVDFRALDTFGEITVIAIAGLAAYALIRLRPSPSKSDVPEER